MQTLGTNYGGWSIPLSIKLDSNSIVYSAGVGEDISFDLNLQDKYKCNIILIDPTKRALTHFKEVRDYYAKKIFKFSGSIQPDYLTNICTVNPNFCKFSYVKKGLYKEKSVLKFYKQTNPKYISQSLVDNMFGKDYDEVEVDSLKNIMSEYNHNRIDLLKLDIEGAEVDVLEQMLNDQIYPKYLCVEFDLLLKNKDPNGLTKKIIDRLQRNNYKILINKNLNITFKLTSKINT
jgi:FkbM family methyltransferase